jgi:predicted amidophosphoribosyltransferase
LVPLACAGCGLEDVRCCEACAAPWWQEPCRSEEASPRLDVSGREPLPVWSLASLSGSAHLMVRAWKDGRRRDLDRFFGDAMFRAASSLADILSEADIVVPVPSHPRSVRVRGVDLTAMLAREAARGLSVAGREVGMERRIANRGRESRSMAASERWLNALAGLRLKPGRLPASVVVLVDDVVTTGASLARASLLLEEAGSAVAGALTLAATPTGAGTSVL